MVAENFEAKALADHWISHRLADGRESVFFADPGHAIPTEIIDDRELDPRGEPGELRLDRLTGDWVAVAAHRQSRTYLPPKEQCPLCPSVGGRHSEIPTEDFDVVVFENRFPSLGPALGQIHSPELGAPITDAPVPAVGRCEVVVFTPDHAGSFGSLTDERARTVVEAWAHRTRELSAKEGIEQVFVFENRGQDIGVTLHHPHGQIYAYPYVTPTAKKIAQRARDHFEKTQTALLGEILESEIADGSRIVSRGEHFTVFVPYAARWPLEAHLVPHRHVPDFAALTEEEKDELAIMYRDLLRRFDGLYDTPTPYIAAWHQAPINDADREATRLHLQLTSPRRAADKLKFLAGSEAAMGAFINDITPEQTAARLREVSL
ncbi:galactose-1-phosphate uridylyltransferase [Arthrobacter sp. NIO-1057]|uniref:galactose-1-phosphate uridylyltransferase n=1 Tax=Arthrobacter sp. NIO-1057 TaxID=993071 RepID=UPI00071E0285|nr:galactose-1-phosphate uridylyltransferase [Arthrobacter sp. NIO-1057]KSU66183.1 galactose-1-phosphate uridylyltransferase [Arthrobacter sp. NIO-1057]SCC34140.1 UDPglucose--hexose-1-phosphate uridylyltransferase [Arthrobacter sp. NIO-1057]